MREPCSGQLVVVCHWPSSANARISERLKQLPFAFTQANARSTYGAHKGGPRMAESSEIAEAFARLALIRDKGDAAARHLFELCTANPEMTRKAAEAFAGIAEIFTRWKGRARDSLRSGHRPALVYAVMRNDSEKIAALIKAGVWLDETDEGETALHWAVSRQHTEIVTMLLDAGANPNVPDNDGYTPLHDVAEMGDCPPARTM